MRQHYKNQCQETFNLIKEIHGELAQRLVTQDYDAVLQLLGDCQQGAISVGTLIEETEGENTQTVRCLEEYCELIFRFHEEISGMAQNAAASDRPGGQRDDMHNPGEARIMDLGESIGNLQQSIAKAEESLANEIPTQYEVVFLPYKASMWDSLESVWKKAVEDENTTVYVIPIPYYDKNPDRSFREVHYEGEQFPEEVSVVSYKDYDFEKRHPDRIYIHNPYDAANYVTSVHPTFYSDKLKGYTDELIYIPYFVLNDDFAPDDPEVTKGIEHFVTVPGVINADKVIVQSETMKKAYVNIMVSHTGEQTREYWEKKILGLGSPKLEKIKNLRVEDYRLPVEWERLLQGKDGKRKKLILYNTSVSAILNHEQKMLVKIRDVLKLFSEVAEDVILLWRPHPLTEATLKSMHPELYGEYMEIVEGYKAAGWGIYDDSPDMDRALVVSDAYYGDPSSLVWLYKATGKPIMIQNCEILNKEK